MRGYNPVEVDEYINFLISKYTELYRENDETTRKLRATVTRLDELKNAEDEIRSTLIDAKRAANKIKADGEAKAESIVRSAKASCNTILADFNDKVELGRKAIEELQKDAFALKAELFERYSLHIQAIEKLTEGMDDAFMPDPEELRRRAAEAIERSVSEEYSEPDAEEAADEVFEDTDGVYEEDITADSTDALVVDREPLIPEGASLKDSAKALGKIYRDSDDTVIHTPDSDVDDAGYMDFVKSVTTKSEASTTKEADFTMLFDDSRRDTKKKK